MKVKKHGINIKKLENNTHKIGIQCSELGVKIYHGTITKNEASRVQRESCSKIVKKDGLAFAKEVYITVYTIMTNINLKRQKMKAKPLEFFTDGMDEYFAKFGITSPYN